MKINYPQLKKSFLFGSNPDSTDFYNSWIGLYNHIAVVTYNPPPGTLSLPGRTSNSRIQKALELRCRYICLQFISSISYDFTKEKGNISKQIILSSFAYLLLAQLENDVSIIGRVRHSR